MKRSMDDLLRDTLRARAADPTAACLDPETAAAFVDGTLAARDRSGAEAHVADCPRCQAALAALVRSTPPPIARAWWRRPAVAWLMPVTAAATAVAIWINVPETPPLATVPTLRDAPLLESSPVQTPPAAAPETLEASRARLREAAAASAQAAAAPRASDVDAAPPVEPNTNRAVAPEPPRPSALAETATAAFRSDMLARAAPVISSNRISQWRLGIGGDVQHSADGGKTWQSQATGVNVTLTAGSSPSPSVCWLVGPDGLVLITTDAGQSWRRVPFPVVTDLVAVRATSESITTILTSDGGSFMTSDGGRSWRQ